MRALKTTLCAGITVLAVMTSPSLAAATPDVPASIESIGEFRVAVKCDSPPYGFLDELGHPSGINVDFARMIARVAFGDPNKAVITCVNSAMRIPVLVSHKVDVVIGDLAPTPARRQIVDFVDGMSWDGSAVLIRASEHLSTLSELDGTTVFVTKGSLQSSYFSHHYPLIKQVKFDSITDAILAFQQGRGEAVSQDVEPLLLATSRDPHLKLANITFDIQWNAPAVRKGDNDWRIFMNRMVALARSNGTFATAVRKYATGQLQGVLLDGFTKPPPLALQREDAALDITGASRAVEPSTPFDPTYVWSVAPKLLRGLLTTIWIAATCVAISIALGYLGTAIIFFDIPVGKQIVQFYVTFMRNTPLLAQIFFFFFGLPAIGIKASATLSGVVVLSLWGGAFNVENLRGGIVSVPRGLLEAGRALGLSGAHIFRCIVVPVGTRTVVPAILNTAVSTAKNTALLETIGVAELTYRAMDEMATSYHTSEMFVALLIGYVSLVALLSVGGAAAERRLSRGFAR